MMGNSDSPTELKYNALGKSGAIKLFAVKCFKTK